MDNVVKFPVPAPDFIHPKSMAAGMTNSEIETMLEAMRVRRLVAVARLNNSKHLSGVASERRLLARYEKVMAEMEKQIDRYDRYVEKLENAANELRALRLQLGEDPQ